MKKIYVLAILAFVVSLSGIIIYSKTNKELPVYSSSAMWMYDTSTPEKAIGISDYAFVAKINKVSKTIYKNPINIEITADGKETKTVYDPYTIYEITVIDNIKGEIITNKSVELMQYGGLNKDGNSYTFLENTKLLTPGNYYILLASVWPEENILEVSEPTRIISLGNNIKTSESVDKINTYKQAYINQEIPNGFNSQNIVSKYDLNYAK